MTSTFSLISKTVVTWEMFCVLACVFEGRSAPANGAHLPGAVMCSSLLWLSRYEEDREDVLPGSVSVTDIDAFSCPLTYDYLYAGSRLVGDHRLITFSCLVLVQSQNISCSWGKISEFELTFKQILEQAAVTVCLGLLNLQDNVLCKWNFILRAL